MPYLMWARVRNQSLTTQIDVTSVGNVHREINEHTPSANGTISSLVSAFELVKIGPFSFIWRPSKAVPATFEKSLFGSGWFTLELAIALRTGQTRSNLKFNFCGFRKSQAVTNGQIKIDAHYQAFEAPEFGLPQWDNP